MELIKMETDSKKLVIAPLGDIQWAGLKGATARDSLRRHIDEAMELNAWFIGMGDYTDFASPSNRSRLKSAMLYDTAEEVLENASDNLVQQVYDRFLKVTAGRWIGLLEGHHFFEFGGKTSDMLLASLLKTRCLGTAAYVHIQPANVTILATHGNGGGTMPGGPANKLYHYSAGLTGADCYLMGHNTKESANRLSRPRPRWNVKKPDLTHADVLLVNTGGFARSNIPHHRRGEIVRGDYAEAGMMTPSPLTAPFVFVDGNQTAPEKRVRVLV